MTPDWRQVVDFLYFIGVKVWRFFTASGLSECYEHGGIELHQCRRLLLRLRHNLKDSGSVDFAQEAVQRFGHATRSSPCRHMHGLHKRRLAPYEAIGLSPQCAAWALSSFCPP